MRDYAGNLFGSQCFVRLVMETTLCDYDRLIFALASNSVNQPMFVGNSARPIALEVFSKQLWLTGSKMRMSQAFAYQVVQFLMCLRIISTQRKIFFPTPRFKCQFHAKILQWLHGFGINMNNVFTRFDIGNRLHQHFGIVGR